MHPNFTIFHKDDHTFSDILEDSCLSLLLYLRSEFLPVLCIKNSIWKSFSGNEKKDESASGIKRNTISRPTAYGEYAPYTFIENEEEFEKLVEKMK